MAQENNTYIVLEPRWMTGRLGLTGNRLVVYALVHGFSRERLGEFYGSAQYIADLLSLRKHTVLDILNQMTSEGLLLKRKELREGVEVCIYRTNPEVVRKAHQGGAETAPGGGAKTAPHNDISQDKSFDISTKGINKQIIGAEALPQVNRIDWRKVLVEIDGCEPQVVEDFLAVRKAKRLPNTLTAYNSMKEEAAAAGISMAEAVKLCAQHTWAGFRRSYLNENRSQGYPTPTPPHKESVFEHNYRVKQQIDAYYERKKAEEGLNK
ncbi:MAG: hypothetical protein IKT99_01410 [Oscillospiraceae bacterium]|nr:hypothetical protein [Oscillospiraceae bacterium]